MAQPGYLLLCTRGYLSCLLVYANGSQDVRGTHVSVYVTLMKGKYDDELAWPMCGTIRITLQITRLGQAPSRRVNLSRRYEGLEQNDWSRAERGYKKCVRHVNLYPKRIRSDSETQYLVNDTLCFRVEAAIGKPWLAAMN